jgi:hypothetical protein
MGVSELLLSRSLRVKDLERKVERLLHIVCAGGHVQYSSLGLSFRSRYRQGSKSLRYAALAGSVDAINLLI